LEDNIKIDFGETERETVDWIELAQDGDKWRVVSYAAMNSRVT
jgi:hypothetical protein